MQLTADLSQLPPETRNALIRKLQHADKASHDLGVVEQTRMKQLYDRGGSDAYKAELGPAQMVLSQDQYQRAMAKYGPLCFMDADFAPWLLKQNEDMRVKYVSKKIQVGFGS